MKKYFLVFLQEDNVITTVEVIGDGSKNIVRTYYNSRLSSWDTDIIIFENGVERFRNPVDTCIIGTR
jgi:hypothetical protein